MYESIKRLSLAVAFLVGVAAGNASSAAAEPVPAANDPSTSSEDVLRQRVSSYWKARSAGSADVMNFYAPAELGGPRRSRDISEFGNVGYRAFEIKQISVGEDSAEVQIEIEPDLSALPLPAEMAARLKKRSLTETWLLVENTWYKKPIPRGFSSQSEDTHTLGDESPDPVNEDEAAKESPSQPAETNEE